MQIYGQPVIDDSNPFRDTVASAAGLKSAADSVFRLVHVSHAEHLAWHPELGWTQYHRGWTYTYAEAVQVQLGREMQIGTQIGKRKVPDEGRWYWHGNLIRLYRGGRT